MRFLLRFFAIASMALLVGVAYGQIPSLDPRHAQFPVLEPRHPADQLVPTITFELVLPGETTPHYDITVDSTGNAALHSRELLTPQQIGTGQPRVLKFLVGQPTCTRLFQLARQAHYFEHSSAPAMATLDPTFATTNTVFTMLAYSYGPVYSYDKGMRSIRNSITFSRTEDPVIQQLTATFEKIYRVLQQGTPTQPVNVTP